METRLTPHALRTPSGSAMLHYAPQRCDFMRPTVLRHGLQQPRLLGLGGVQHGIAGALHLLSVRDDTGCTMVHKVVRHFKGGSDPPSPARWRYGAGYATGVWDGAWDRVWDGVWDTQYAAT